MTLSRARSIYKKLIVTYRSYHLDIRKDSERQRLGGSKTNWNSSISPSWLLAVSKRQEFLNSYLEYNLDSATVVNPATGIPQ